jgi:hypothetical protein
MIGLAGMRRLMAGPRAKTPGEWPRRILNAVEQHRRGVPEDDTLIIEVVRVIDERPYAAVEVRQRETVKA